MIDPARIEAVLSHIRPILQVDGGNLELVDVQGYDATIRCTWLCGECTSAELTMYTGLTELLREAIPEFGELHLV